MIFPGQINTYISDEKLPWEYTWIEFDGLRAKETIELSGLSLDNPIYKATSKDLREILKEELLYIASHGDATPFHLIGISILQLMLLFVLLPSCRHQNQPSSGFFISMKPYLI